MTQFIHSISIHFNFQVTQHKLASNCRVGSETSLLAKIRRATAESQPGADRQALVAKVALLRMELDLADWAWSSQIATEVEIFM